MHSDVTSSSSLIAFNVYDRSSPDHGFLGTVQVKPVLIHDHTVDGWYKLKPFENEPVTGEMRVQITFEQYKTKHPLTPKSFEFLKLIGRGTFGKVFQVRKRDTHRIYAMKVSWCLWSLPGHGRGFPLRPDLSRTRNSAIRLPTFAC